MPSVLNPFFENPSATKIAAARDAIRVFLATNKETKEYTFPQLRANVPECATLTAAELTRAAESARLVVKP